jgi:LysR family hydrogen peroxide-inducible transcriptional activator
MVTLRQLRYFETLARTKHFGLAADQCAVTQPALSMQIKELERELGVELVERRGNAIAMTPAGQEIAARSEAILSQVRELSDFARQHHGVLTGSLRLGIIPSIAPYLLPDILTEVMKHYPQLDLQIRETQTNALVEELVRGELDAVLVALPVEPPQLETMPLFEDRFLIAVQRQAARDWAAGDLPELCAKTEVDRQRVALIAFPEEPPMRIVGLAWRRSSARQRDFAALGELIKSLRCDEAGIGKPAKL